MGILCDKEKRNLTTVNEHISSQTLYRLSRSICKINNGNNIYFGFFMKANYGYFLFTIYNMFPKILIDKKKLLILLLKMGKNIV